MVSDEQSGTVGGMPWHAHFADELAAECVDDTGDRGLLALADEVEVEHALDGTGLQSAVHIVLEACLAAARGGGAVSY